MKIYAHASHWYEDSARHITYKFGPDGVYDVPSDTGAYMLEAHPDKFCPVEDAATQHSCGHVPAETHTNGVQDYQHREMETPPEDRQMVLTRRTRQRKPR